MRLRLIENWRQVLAHAWSVRWMFLGNVMAALPLLVDQFQAYVSQRAYAVLLVAANLLAFFSRFLKQEKVSGDA
jgi:hypothetical protein